MLVSSLISKIHPQRECDGLGGHNETPSFIDVHMKIRDISDTSTKKTLRETDLENLKCVYDSLGETSARDRGKNEKGCSFKRIITLDLTVLERGGTLLLVLICPMPMSRSLSLVALHS